MKRIFWFGIFLLAAAALVFLLNSKKSASVENSPADKIAGSKNFITNNLPAAPIDLTSVAGAVSNSPAENLAAKAGEMVADTNAVTDLPPQTVLQNVRRAVRQYGEMFGGNPIGDNSEISAALNGKNPKQINFIDPSAGMRLNEKGELVDAWNTPYFFHQLSASDMDIRSAGLDKIMWTSDDLIVR
jgi:hypothetical protein